MPSLETASADVSAGEAGCVAAEPGFGRGTGADEAAGSEATVSGSAAMAPSPFRLVFGRTERMASRTLFDGTPVGVRRKARSKVRMACDVCGPMRPSTSPL